MNKQESLFVKIFKRISSGFLLGVGFTIAMILVGFIASQIYDTYTDKTNNESTAASYKFKDFNENSGLDVTNYQDKSTPEKLLFIGTLTNNSEQPWKNINIEVELFQNDEFVSECSDFINNTVKPNETENFQVSCGGCDNYILPTYDKFTIKINNAY